MFAHRLGAIALTAAGIAVAGLCIWVPHLLLVFVGVFVVGAGVSWLLEVRHREQVESVDRRAIRALLSLTLRLPAAEFVTDPGSGQRFGRSRPAEWCKRRLRVIHCGL